MSAFVLSELHINVLATYAERRAVRAHWNGQCFDFERHAARLAGVLYTSNVEAVNTRYDEDTRSDDHCFRRIADLAFTPVCILKALASYDYQTSELDNYDQSLACALVRAIRNAAISELPGYEEAPWTIDAL